MAFKFSDKAIDFIKTPSRIDILEGGGRTGKTTVALFKFGMMVNNSKHKQHMLAATDNVVAMRNLVISGNGFLDLFHGHAKKGTRTENGVHIVFKDSEGIEKIIYIVGYKDKARWTKILGSTIGCVMVDEVNLADPDFIAQIYRSGASVEDWYLSGTLNPNNPDLEIYSTLINRTRPLKKYVDDIPMSILLELKANKNILSSGVYWHFNFTDNPAMTTSKVKRFKEMYPEDSFFYKSLILGERGVTEGVIFGKYLTADLNINPFVTNNPGQHWQDEFIKFSIGIDLGNNDTKLGTILTFVGVHRKFRSALVLDAYPCEKKEANELVEEMCQKIIEWYISLMHWGKFHGVFIDGYGVIEIIVPTIRKRLIALGYSQIFVDLCIKFGEDGGRGPRMMLLLIMINQKRLLFNQKSPGALESKKQLAKIVYDEKDNLPLDENRKESDYYDSLCYAITPFYRDFNKELKVGAKYEH